MRTQAGVYMIELIMAIAVSAMLSAALVQTLADTERLSTAGQNQIIAAALAQEQIDNVRNTLYGDLQIGTFELLLNKRQASDAGPDKVNPRPLLFDLTAFDWRTPSERAGQADQITCAASNQFRRLGSDEVITDAQITETVANGPIANTKLVTVRVSWSEGPAPKQYVVQTLVAQNGIHIY